MLPADADTEFRNSYALEPRLVARAPVAPAAPSPARSSAGALGAVAQLETGSERSLPSSTTAGELVGRHPVAGGSWWRRLFGRFLRPPGQLAPLSRIHFGRALSPKSLELGDGSSRSAPLRVVAGDYGSVPKGRWFVPPDGSGPWYKPTDDEFRAFARSLTDAALHRRSLPSPPPDWGAFTGWKSTTWKVAVPVLQTIGAVAGGIVGGPGGAKAGAAAGGTVAKKVWS